jgi:hypothetical protein
LNTYPGKKEFLSWKDWAYAVEKDLAKLSQEIDVLIPFRERVDALENIVRALIRALEFEASPGPCFTRKKKR